MNRNILTYLIVFLLLPFVAGAQFISKDKREKKEVVVVSGLNSEQELCRVIGSKFAVPTVNYEPVTPPKFWKKGILTEVGFSQVSLTNWAAGGSGSVALNT